jgi:hypothetical protein
MAREDGFTPFTLKFRFEEPEDAENFLLGCIIARSNNSNSKFPKIIDGINKAMQPYHKTKLEQEIEARGSG